MNKGEQFFTRGKVGEWSKKQKWLSATVSCYSFWFHLPHKGAVGDSEEKELIAGSHSQVIK